MRDSFDYDEHNIELHSQPESVDAYSEYVEDGLEDDEAAAIARYFTDTDATVLDVGCGTGRTTWPLAAMGFDAVGIDVSEQMVDEARSNVADTPFLVADAGSLAFADDVFDYALFSYNGLDLLWPESKRHDALAEIYRVLKPGGIFVFSSRNAWGLPSPVFPLSWRKLASFVASLGYLLVSGRFRKHYEETGVGIRTGNWEATGASYFINPVEQQEQLREHGFRVIDIIGSYVSPSLHYVGWKPPGAGHST